MMKCNVYGLGQRVSLLLLGWLLVACHVGGEAAVEPTAMANTAVSPATPTLVTVSEEIVVTTIPVTEVPPTAVPSTQTPVSPTVTPPAISEDVEQLRQELQTLAFAPDTYEGVYAFPLPQDASVWLAHSVGFRPYETVGSHAAALYGYEAGQWQELGRTELATPDILYEGTLTVVDLGDGRYWFEEHSFIGAHGSCYELLRYDLAVLAVALSHCHSSNASNGVEDVNRDGRPDIILNQSDDYVFCYACGVRYPHYDVFEFVDGVWQPVSVSLLPDDAFPDLRDTNNEAVRLYQMGLFKQAVESINLIVGDVPAVLWNQAIINMYAEAGRFQAQAGPFPLLGQVFYGDYEAVLAMMRPYPPAQLFTRQNNPLLTGTMAEGWEDTLADWVTMLTAEVVEGQPDMASAHFLYAWGLYLTDPTNARVTTALETAVSLNPDEPLYQESLAYLHGN